MQTSRVGKVDIDTKKLNKRSLEEGWNIEFVGDQVINNLDSLAYDKFTKTGSAVEDKFDLQVSLPVRMSM